MIRRSARILLIIAVLFSTTGCWDAVDVNELAIITGIAVERGEHAKFKLYVEGLNPTELVTGKSTGFTPSLEYGFEGNSATEIMNKMNIAFSRRTFYAHMRVLVLDEELVKAGEISFIDLLDRFHETREDFYVLIAKDVPASSILRIATPLLRAPSLKVFRQIDSFEKDWLGDSNTTFRDFMKALTSPGREAVTLAVTVKGNIKRGETVDNNKNLIGKTFVQFSGAGVLKKQKLIGYISLDDFRNSLMVQNRATKTTLVVPCARDKVMHLDLYHAKSDVKIDVKNGEPKISIKLNVESRLNGTQCYDDLTKMSTYNDIEEKTEKRIKSHVEETIKHVQKAYQADIFGFGEEMYRQHYKQFKKWEKDWDKHFAEADVDVKVNVKLRRSGVRNKTFRAK